MAEENSPEFQHYKSFFNIVKGGGFKKLDTTQAMLKSTMIEHVMREKQIDSFEELGKLVDLYPLELMFTVACMEAVGYHGFSKNGFILIQAKTGVSIQTWIDHLNN